MTAGVVSRREWSAFSAAAVIGGRDAFARQQDRRWGVQLYTIWRLFRECRLSIINARICEPASATRLKQRRDLRAARRVLPPFRECDQLAFAIQVA